VKRGKEPDVANFISALVADNNAQLMVMICASIAGSTTLTLVAAAHQTGSRVVCILSGLDEFHASKKALGPYANYVEFAVGYARTLLLDDYRGADFVLIDCHIKEQKGVFLAAKKNAKHDGELIVGYNALHKESWWTELSTHFLPIGEGLLVTRTVATNVVRDSPKRS
jgi:predicted O-methyltransferase YrrM